MSITEFHKLEQKFLNGFGFELDEPVYATLSVRGESLKAIVIPRIDIRGNFVLSYYEAEDDYSQPSDQPGVREISALSRSVLDFAKAADDEVSVELRAQNSWGFPGKECLKVNARVIRSEPSHKGRLRLHNGQIAVGAEENSSVVRAEFSLLNLPMIDHPPDRRVELVATGWRVVLSLDPEMTRGQPSYTGIVEKCDKSPFEMEELDDLLELLTWFLSYVAAGECFPTSVVGYDSDSREVFVRLLRLKLRKPYRSNWFDNNSWVKDGVILEYLFPKFCSIWKIHKEEIAEIIRAYLEAREVKRHISGRLAVRVSYTGLEVLAELIGKSTLFKGKVRVDDVLEFYKIPHLRLCENTEPRLHSLCRKLDIRDLSGPVLLRKVRNSATHILERGRATKDPGGTIMDKESYNYSVLVDLSQFYLEYLFLEWLACKGWLYEEKTYRSLIEYYNPERGAAP